MSLFKSIFQLHKLQKLLTKQKHIEEQTHSLKQELLKSELANLLGMIVKESSTEQIHVPILDVDLTPPNIENIEAAPVSPPEQVIEDSSTVSVEDDTTVQVDDKVKVRPPEQNIEEDVFCEEVAQKLLVTIQSFDPDNDIVFLQAEDRMFDFPYSPEDHVGVSEGDKRELTIYKDNTYLFEDINSLEVNAA